MLLRRANIKYVPTMLSNYYYRHKDDYFIAFSDTIKTDNDDLTPFLYFVLVGARESLNEIKDAVVYYIYKFTLKDYYVHLKNSRAISQRQYELLAILIEENVGINLKRLNDPPFRTLYNKTSERTARRDLLKLHEINVLVLDGDDNNYWINYKALG